jgi:hypothetical protein
MEPKVRPPVFRFWITNRELNTPKPTRKDPHIHIQQFCDSQE